MKRQIISIINIISYAFLIWASISVNASQVFMGSGGAPYIMPAPYAFSIWILIYLLLGIWLVSQFFVSEIAFTVYEKVSRFFAINMVFTGGSLLVSNTLAPVMIGMSLITLICMYITMNRAMLTLKVEKQDRILKELKYFGVPFSIFMGWVSVALMVDIAVVLKANGFTQLLGLGEQLWGIIMLIVGGLLAIYTRNASDDILYPLVFIWAYISIAIYNMSTFPILITACGVIVMIAFLPHNKTQVMIEDIKAVEMEVHRKKTKMGVALLIDEGGRHRQKIGQTTHTQWVEWGNYDVEELNVHVLVTQF